MHLKIIMSRFSLVISTLYVCYYAFFDYNLSLVGFNATTIGHVSNLLFCIVVILNYKSFKYLFADEYRWINLTTAVLCVIMVYSSYSNNNTLFDFYSEDYESETTPNRILWRALKFFFSLFFIESVIIYKKSSSFLAIVRNYMIIYIFFLSIAVYAGGRTTIWGGKFSIFYINIYLCFIQWLISSLEGKKQNFLGGLIVVNMLFLCYVTECSTGILASCLLIFLFFTSSNKIKTLLYNPGVMISYLMFCNIVLFFFSTWLLSISWMQDFITNVLKEDLTITGRLQIYESITDAFYEKPWFGLGPENYKMVALSYMTGCANAQNGIANLFLEIGLCGTVTFIFWLYLFFKHCVLSLYSYPMVVFLYVFSTISSVEIPFSMVSFYVMIPMMLINKK